jgi:hypothetical protein
VDAGIFDENWGSSSLHLSGVRPNWLPRRKETAPCTSEPQPAKASLPAVVSGPAQWARPSFPHGTPFSAFTGASRRDAALSCQSPALSKGSAPGAQWLPAGLGCRTQMPYCRACPRRPQCQESSTPLGPRRKSSVLWPLSSSHSDSSLPPNPASSSPVSAPVLVTVTGHTGACGEPGGSRDPQPNSRLEKLRSALATTRTSLHREGLDPSGACAIFGFPGTSACRAMRVRRMRPGSSSRFMDSQPPLPLPLALISLPLPNLDLVPAVLFLASRSFDLATVLVLRLFSEQRSS